MRRSRRNSASSSVAMSVIVDAAAASACNQSQIGPTQVNFLSQSLPLRNDTLTDPALMAIRYGMKNTLDLVEEIISSCPTAEERKSAIKRLQVLMLKLIKDEIAYNKTTEVINGNPDEEVPDDDSLDDKEIMTSFEKVLPTASATMKAYESSLSQKTLKKHAMYRRLMDEIGKFEQEAVDEELSQSILTDNVDTEHVPTIDPISKTKLMDPVRNSICKHVYGHASILQLIRKNPKFRCPTMGCSNGAFIKARDLEVDPQLTALVKKKQEEGMN